VTVRFTVHGRGILVGSPDHLRGTPDVLALDPVDLRNRGIVLPISFGTAGLVLDAHVAIGDASPVPPAFRVIDEAEGWLDVRGGEIAFRDLDELSAFDPVPPPGRSVAVTDGAWRVRVRHQSTDRDGEILLVFSLFPLDAPPARSWDDVMVLSYG
jgi:hypothetical protein